MLPTLPRIVNGGCINKHSQVAALLDAALRIT